MNVEFRELRVFMVLAEELSFARAARRLNMSQPALSRLTQKLETKVGAKLLERTTRKVELTRAGESFLINATELLERLENACDTARRLASGSMGELRVGYTDFAISGPLAQIVRDFRKSFPGVTPTLSRGSTERQYVELESGDLDVGFVIPPIEHPNLKGRLAWRERFVVVMPEGHLLADRREVSLTALDGLPMVTGERERWNAYRKRLFALFAGGGISPEIVEEGPDTQVILGLVEAGFGLAIYPECVVNLARRGLIVRPLDCGPGSDEWIETHVCWHRDHEGKLLANFLATLDSFVAGWRDRHIPADPVALSRLAQERGV